MKHVLALLLIAAIPYLVQAQIRILPLPTRVHVGDTVMLRWAPSGDTSSVVRLEFTTGYNAPWALIAKDVRGTSLPWVIPDSMPARFSVRVIRTDRMPDRRIIPITLPGLRVEDIRINDDGNRCLVHGSDDTVRLVDLLTDGVVSRHHTWGSYRYGFDGLSFDIGGNCYIADISTQQYGHPYLIGNVCEARTGRVLFTIKSNDEWEVIANPKGTRLLNEDPELGAQLWNLETRTLITSFPNESNPNWDWEDLSQFKTRSTETDRINIRSAVDGSLITSFYGTDVQHPGYCNSDDIHARIAPLTVSNGTEIRDLSTYVSLGTLPIKCDYFISSQDRNRYLTTKGNRIQLWNARTLRPIASLRGKPLRDKGYGFSPDSRYIHMLIENGHHRIWDAVTGKRIADLRCGWTYDDLSKCGDVSECMADTEWDDDIEFSDDGKYIVVIPDCHAHSWMYPTLFEAKTGKLITRLKGMDEVEFSASSNYIIGTRTTLDDTINYTHTTTDWLLDARTGKRIVELGARDPNHYIPNDSRYLIYIAGNTLNIWDPDLGKPVARLQHNAEISSFNLTGNRLVTLDINGCARLWNTANWQPVATLTTSDGKNILIEQDEQYVAVYCINNERRVAGWNFWDMRTGELLLQDTGWHPRSRSYTEFSGDANSFGVLFPDSTGVIYRPRPVTVTVTNADTINVIMYTRERQPEPDTSKHVQPKLPPVSPSSTPTIGSLTQPGSSDSTMMKPNGGITTLPNPFSGEYAQESILSSDNTRCLVQYSNYNVCLWDVPNRRVLRTGSINKYLNESIRYSGIMGNGQYCRFYVYDSLRGCEIIQLMDIRTGEPVIPSDTNTRKILVNQQGTRALRFNEKGNVMLWDLKSGKTIRTLEGIHELEFSCIGERMIGEFTQSASGKVLQTGVWDTKDGSLLCAVSGKQLGYYECTNESEHLLPVLDSTVVHILDVTAGAVSGEFRTRSMPQSIDLKQEIITTTSYHNIQIWNARTYRLNTTITETESIESPTISPDGKRILNFRDYGRYSLVDATTGKTIAEIRCDWTPGQIRKYCDDCMANLNDFVEFSKDGTRIVISPSCNSISGMTAMLFDGTTGRLITRLNGMERAHFVDGGNTILCRNKREMTDGGSYDEVTTFHLFSARTGKRIADLLTTHKYANNMDAESVIVGMNGTNLEKWDLSTGKLIYRLPHPAELKEFDTASDRAMTIDAAGSVRLWNTITHKQIAILTEELGYGVSFSPDGAYAAVYLADSKGSNNGWVFYEASSGKPILQGRITGYNGYFGGSGSVFPAYDSKNLYIYHLAPITQTEQKSVSPKLPLPPIPNTPPLNATATENKAVSKESGATSPTGPVIR